MIVCSENSAFVFNVLLICFFVVFSSDAKDGQTETRNEKGD